MSILSELKDPAYYLQKAAYYYWLSNPYANYALEKIITSNCCCANRPPADCDECCYAKSELSYKTYYNPVTRHYYAIEKYYDGGPQPIYESTELCYTPIKRPGSNSYKPYYTPRIC
jgi:hypothetical protein